MAVTITNWTAVEREGVRVRRGLLFWYALDASERADAIAPVYRSATRRGAIVKVVRGRFERRADEVRRSDAAVAHRLSGRTEIQSR
jgi:hypothetical protein